MSQLILIACGLFFYMPSTAQASVHVDLNVKINMDKHQLEIAGKSSKLLNLPEHARDIEQSDTRFKYNWPLPVSSKSDDWQGGAFASGKNLYLPSDWHPNTDELMTYSLTIDAPMIVIASGAISDEAQSQQRYKAHFHMDRAIETIALFAGPYKIKTQQHKGIMLRTYFYEGMESLSGEYLQRTAQYIDRFNQQIGPFPFPNFHIIAAPVPAGYGFAGLTYMGARVLQLPFIKETSLGHEILHNYWGNGVFPDYQTGNWAEGLTTYMADYMTAEATSPDKAKDMRLSWLRSYAALPKADEKPVTSFVSKHGQASQIIGYHKVAFIFHMLRQELGDDLFFQALRKFWLDYAFKIASWQDIERIFSQTSNQNLAVFFKQWVKGTGAPEIKSISATTQRQKNALWDINITAVQATPVFKTPLPLTIGMGNQLIQKTALLKGRITRKTLSMKNAPLAVSVDPDFHLFRKLSPNEVSPILRDVMLSKEVQLVVTNTDDDFIVQAKKLATRMVDGTITLSSQQDIPKQAFILSGQDKKIAQRLKKWRLSEAPFDKNLEGDAHIWAGRIDPQTPYIIISLSDMSKLAQIKRSLPHYGKRSGLIYMGSKAIYKLSNQTRAMSTPVN